MAYVFKIDHFDIYGDLCQYKRASLASKDFALTKVNNKFDKNENFEVVL